MQVSDSHRMVFIHVQKTGGSSFDKMLAAQVPDLRLATGVSVQERHMALAGVLAAEPALADYFIFGFVRNPWARLVSWWTMIQNAKTRNDRRLGTNPLWIAVAGYQDFDEYIHRGLAEVPALGRPQAKMLATPTRRADYVGRHETYLDDVRGIFARLGLKVPESEEDLEHRNVTKNRRPYQEYYTDATRDLVAKAYKRDLEVFNYRF